jgi:DNA-binding PucR family transcriptional regulator
MRYFQRSRGLGRAAGMVALVDADVCGFVPDLPRERAPAVIGVSEPVPAHALPDAFAAASRALDAAIAMNVGPGIYDLGAIGVRAAVHADRDIGAMLARRFIAPLREKGRSGEVILDTVRRHLENECHLDTTAREMWVHVNTVRYRLRRFESLTDCSLRRTDDLVAVWWALAYVGLEGEPVVPVVGGDEEDGA